MVKKRGKKFGLLAIKLLIVFAAFYYVSQNTEFEKVWQYVGSANILYLAIALMIFIVMQYFMAMRLRNILAREGKLHSKSFLFKAQISGFFLNLALPGFVGGDGYVSYRLKADKDVDLKTSIKALINSRAGGFFYVLSCAYLCFLVSDFTNHLPNAKIVIGGIFALQILVYHLFAKYYFGESLQQFFSTSVYSIIIQLLGAVFIFCILKAIGIADYIIEYITVFFTGEAISMLPLTPLGLGIREFIFLNAAEKIGLYPEKAVAVSMTVFALFVATAFIGLIFYFTSKEKKNGST